MTEISEAMTNRIAMAVASAHLVIHPGPRVYWGRQELMIYTGCTKNSLRELTGRPDFPRPVSSNCKNPRWPSLDVVRWYEANIVAQDGRPRAA